MNNRIVFDDFKKKNKNKKQNRQVDEDEFAVLGGKLTEDAKKTKNVKRTNQTTGGWGDEDQTATMGFLVGKAKDEKPQPQANKNGASRFTNTKKKNINWNSKLEGAPDRVEIKPTQKKIGTWGDEPKQNAWNSKASGKGILIF